ncbi:MAG: tRNA (adenine(22)-N(1))-methyltransferase [Oscillospiraceae bacterium]
MLGNRLAACARFVKGDRACDVGTDHGYLAAELLLSGKCSFAIAADINEKPLESARNTLHKHGLDERSRTVLSDGVRNVDLDGVTDIVIAGMGGELISNILSQKPLDGINLVLQPMTKAPSLRRFLAENGFELLGETAVTESGRLYTVMNAVFTGKKREISELETLVGKLSPTEENARQLLLSIAEKLKKESDALKASGNAEQSEHRRSLSEQIIQLAENERSAAL